MTSKQKISEISFVGTSKQENAGCVKIKELSVFADDISLRTIQQALEQNLDPLSDVSVDAYLICELRNAAKALNAQDARIVLVPSHVKGSWIEAADSNCHLVNYIFVSEMIDYETTELVKFFVRCVSERSFSAEIDQQTHFNYFTKLLLAE